MQEHFREVDERGTFYGVKQKQRTLRLKIFMIFMFPIAIIQARQTCLQGIASEVDERGTFYGVKQKQRTLRLKIFMIFMFPIAIIV